MQWRMRVIHMVTDMHAKELLIYLKEKVINHGNLSKELIHGCLLLKDEGIRQCNSLLCDLFYH